MDDSERDYIEINAIHNEPGYQTVRNTLAHTGNTSLTDPNIQVTDVDLLGDRVLKLQHRRVDGVPLEKRDRERTLAHCRRLWGYDVTLTEIDDPDQH